MVADWINTVFDLNQSNQSKELLKLDLNQSNQSKEFLELDFHQSEQSIELLKVGPQSILGTYGAWSTHRIWLFWKRMEQKHVQMNQVSQTVA